MKVLIAEDDFASRKYMYEFMKRFGDVDITVDGAEAVDAFLMAVEDRTFYDLVCLDIMMPNMNGVEALQAIRTIEREYQLEKDEICKIIMMSALSDREYILRARNLGCNGYANKPVSLERLMETMQRMKLPIGECP